MWTNWPTGPQPEIGALASALQPITVGLKSRCVRPISDIMVTMPATRVFRQRLRRPLWLAREVWRFNIALLVGSVLAAGYEFLVPEMGSEITQALLTYIAWGIGAFTTYPVLTGWYFAVLDHEQLGEVVRRSRPRYRWLDRWLGGGSVSDWGSGVVILSLGAVIGVLTSTSLKTNPWVLLMCGILVVSAWFMMVHLYAGYYLRTDVGTRGLRFPGDERPVYSDYVYFAQQIQTTFGGSDVNIISKAMRSSVNVHNMLAYAFSTVVVALLVSGVLGLAR